MKLTINVTPEDIANGKPGESDSCPIALAIRRAKPDARNVYVDDDGEFEVDHVIHVAEFPRKAREFVANFDTTMGRPQAMPFTFEAEFEPKISWRYLDDDDR